MEMAAASDADMGSCILDLYRSATPNPHHEWGPLAPTHAAGPRAPRHRRSLRRRGAGSERWRTALGAGFAPIDGAGHFWPYQAPDAGAAVLTAFWDGLG